MNPDYWYKQTKANPLFDDLLWSRPENRAFAGKLLIVGGNGQGFAAAGEAYGYADKAGIGVSRVLLPDALQKNIGRLFPEAEFAPSTPSGSFAQTATGELLPMAHWANGVLFAGDLGRNSETAIMLEAFLRKHSGAVTLTKDAIEYVAGQPALIAERPDTLLVLSFSQLQKLASEFKFTTAFTSTLDLIRTVDALRDLTLKHPIYIVTKHLDQMLVAVDGQVSTTPCPIDERIWRLKIASAASVWWLQNPGKPFEAITTSLIA